MVVRGTGCMEVYIANERSFGNEQDKENVEKVKD